MRYTEIAVQFGTEKPERAIEMNGVRAILRPGQTPGEAARVLRAGGWAVYARQLPNGRWTAYEAGRPFA